MHERRSQVYLFINFRYFENIKDSVEKAILLYRKCGALGKAISLCFQHKLYQSLAEVVMNEKVNPSVLCKCAELFMEAQMYDSAMYAYFNCGQPAQALLIATEHKVLLNEELVENLVSEEIANLLMSQKHYILACKKFIQLGQKLKAMQALLRSGDKEKILYFASSLKTLIYRYSWS
jgi:intraflagellar transport protein 140